MTSISKNEIKPQEPERHECPYCHDEPYVQEFSNGGFATFCMDCWYGGNGPGENNWYYGHTKEESINAWNTSCEKIAMNLSTVNSEQQYYFEVERPVVCMKYECIRVKAASKEEALELVKDETFWDANELDVELVDDHEVIRYDDPVITKVEKIEKEEENELG